MANQPFSDDDHDPGPRAGSAEPGAQLRAAREERGWHIERIAGELHLAPRVVQAIEQGAYEALPSAVYVTGYIRNYARLVGLDPAPLVAGYRAHIPDVAPPPLQAPNPPRSSPANPPWLVLVASLALLGVLGGLGMMWWQGELGSPPYALDDESSTLADEPASLPGGSPPPPERPAVESQWMQQSSISSYDRAAAGAQPVGDPSTIDPLPTRGATPPSQTGQTSEPPIDDASSVQQETLPVPGQVATSGVAAETPPAEPPKVVMVFDGKCWVDVRDSAGGFRLVGTFESGDRRELGGTPPYSMNIGNTTVLRLTVGGKPFDLEPLTRGRVVAKFNLDPSQAGE